MASFFKTTSWVQHLIVALSFAAGQLFAGEPGAATDPSAITVTDGFRVELLYSVPLEEQGTWIAMATDPQGRLICSDQGGGLYRVTPGRDANETKVEALQVDIGQAHGLVYAHESLYVVVNGSAAEGLGLYRVRDTNGDDQFDEVKLLKAFSSSKPKVRLRSLRARLQHMVFRSGHGPHGVTVGSDGMIYVTAGNHTGVYEGNDPNSPYKNWREDLLLPRNPDGEGLATGIAAPGGWIARTDPDGKRWELLCGGLRNAYDIAFNTDGELFTFDADMEFDTGTPWYRPTRVNHLISGAEFGWRYGTGKWPAYYADSLGSVVDVGLSSPTGVVFGTAAKFPAKYQRAFFVGDWAYGKMFAVHMTPRGSSYTATFETFLSGKPLAITDIVIHDDGAMYFLIGGRRAQSGLYRVTYTGNDATQPVAAIVDDQCRDQRELRRKLASFHGAPSSDAVDFVWPHLNDPDRYIRYTARVAIEHQDPSTWEKTAFAETRSTAAIQAMLALTRSGQTELQSQIIERLNKLPLEHLTEDQQLEALRVYALAFVRLGGANEETATAVAERLNAMFPGSSELVNRELCRILVYVKAPGIVGRALEQLKVARTQENQMFYVFTLRTLDTGWTREQRKTYFGWLNMADEKYEGGKSFLAFLRRIRRDAAARMDQEERNALKDVILGRESVASVDLETTRQFVHNWQAADLHPLIDQVEKGRSFESGKLAYAAAQCGNCHRFAGEGASTGPDLTGVGSRFDSRYILDAILSPSKVIPEQYRTSVITTNDGDVLSGRVIEDDGKTVYIRTNPYSDQLTAVAADDIEDRRLSPLSEMPTGLINVLSKEEVLDLIAYLRSAGDPKE